MSLKCLAVDSDLNIASVHTLAWAKHGITMDCAKNMTEAIHMLQSIQPWEYIFVGINGDVIDFMPLLSTMRSVTNTFIMIATSHFTTEKEIEALKNGADLYARWHNSPDDNVSSVLAHIARKTKRDDVLDKVLIHNDIILAPSQHYAFIGNKPLDLTPHEFDLLHFFIANAGRVLAYGQIFSAVWNEEYDNSAYSTIKSMVQRLRKKIAKAGGNRINIQNKWGIGYKLPLDKK